ncbi:hypothetical protein A2U01_0110721, partial [Trifolium medium]|nr:hypothetical protein [Trifolium medium]
QNKCLCVQSRIPARVAQLHAACCAAQDNTFCFWRVAPFKARASSLGALRSLVARVAQRSADL